jgi:zinc and cadmium transporter
MNILSYILIFTLIGSVISLVGGILLLINEKFTLGISHYLSAFAAGALLGVSFFDLLPEAFEEMEHLMEEGTVGEINIFMWVLGGVLAFFLLERFIHHHDSSEGHGQKEAVVPLIIVGDTVHNFIDGVAIAATFLISIPLGIITTLAVAAHEIPQEIADFGLMLSKGVKRGKVLWINLLSSLSAILGAILTFIYRDSLEGLVPIILALTAGFFIYIASSNLIPEIHSNENKKVAFWESAMLFIGVLVIYITISSLEGTH